jgi:hypothetical protein
MPIECRIGEARWLISATCSAHVTFDEVMDHFAELVQDPRCPTGLDVLLNLTATTSIPETGQLRKVTDVISLIQLRVRFRACAIASLSDVSFGVGRIFSAFAGQAFQSIVVVRTIEEAEARLASQGFDSE